MRLLTFFSVQLIGATPSSIALTCLLVGAVVRPELERLAYRVRISLARREHRPLRFRFFDYLVRTRQSVAFAVALTAPVTPMTVVRR